MSIIKGDNMSSRLFQVVLEKHGLAYAIHSSVELFVETGLLHIQAGLTNERTSQALELILREVSQAFVSAPSAPVSYGAKDYAIRQLRIGLEARQPDDVGGENIMCYGRSSSRMK
jgi:predicted Zn-dependent peptidase